MYSLVKYMGLDPASSLSSIFPYFLYDIALTTALIPELLSVQASWLQHSLHDNQRGSFLPFSIAEKLAVFYEFFREDRDHVKSEE